MPWATTSSGQGGELRRRLPVLLRARHGRRETPRRRKRLRAETRMCREARRSRDPGPNRKENAQGGREQDPGVQEGPREASTSGSAERSVSVSPGDAGQE